MTDLLIDPPVDGSADAPGLILAHGAGTGMDSPFMDRLAGSLAGRGIRVWRFDFPYMQKRREDGRKRPPDRQPVLLAHFSQVVKTCRAAMGENQPLVVGGKSMGGRMASLLAAEPDAPDVQGVACFGYPFHPPGKPDNWRTGHFPEIRVPVVICQGTRDPFGKPGELEHRQPLPSHVCVHWLEGGDHDLRPLRRQRLAPDGLIDQSAALVADFIRSLG